jgi:hypothetical protein
VAYEKVDEDEPAVGLELAAVQGRDDLRDGHELRVSSHIVC